MRDGRTHVVYLGRPPMRFASRYATEPSYTLFVIAGQHQVFIPPVDHPEDVLVCLRFVGRRRLHPMLKSGSVCHVTLSVLIVVVE